MEGESLPRDGVVRILLLAACGAWQVRDAVAYLRKRFPRADRPFRRCCIHDRD